jgi:hypothetical protein
MKNKLYDLLNSINTLKKILSKVEDIFKLTEITLSNYNTLSELQIEIKKNEEILLYKVKNNADLIEEVIRKTEVIFKINENALGKIENLAEKFKNQTELSKNIIEILVNEKSLTECSINHALSSSAELYNKYLLNKKIFNNDLELIEHAIELAGDETNFLEFGVFQGRTLRAIANKIGNNKKAFGFDSFEGLPETWRVGFEKSAFAVNVLPEVPNNVSLYKGWFDSSIPQFKKDHNFQVGFLHIDCDLYSSTKCIFELLRERLKNETIIIFDEYFNYPGWENHEFKALNEFVNKYNYSYEYIGCVPSNQQVLVVLKKAT